jgi:ABC-type Fe3+ transport system permease subunit
MKDSAMWILVIIVVLAVLAQAWRALRALSRQLPDRPEHLVLF